MMVKAALYSKDVLQGPEERSTAVGTAKGELPRDSTQNKLVRRCDAKPRGAHSQIPIICNAYNSQE